MGASRRCSGPSLQLRDRHESHPAAPNQLDLGLYVAAPSNESTLMPSAWAASSRLRVTGVIAITIALMTRPARARAGPMRRPTSPARGHFYRAGEHLPRLLDELVGGRRSLGRPRPAQVEVVGFAANEARDIIVDACQGAALEFEPAGGPALRRPVGRGGGGRILSATSGTSATSRSRRGAGCVACAACAASGRCRAKASSNWSR